MHPGRRVEREKMSVNYQTVEKTYDIDFRGKKYAVVHIELVNHGEKRESTRVYNNLVDARADFNETVQYEQNCYNSLIRMLDAPIMYVTGDGICETDDAFGVYDTRDGELVSQVLLITNLEI